MSGVVASLARFEGRMLVRPAATVAGVSFLVPMVVASLGSPSEADAYSVLGGLGAATLGPFALGSAWWHLVWLLGCAGLGIAAVLLDRRSSFAAAGTVGILVRAGGAQRP